MLKNESNELPVLMVAFVIVENVSPVGLPILRFYVKGDNYVLFEGEELLKKALIESVKRRNDPNFISLGFAVEVLPMSQRKRRRRLGGAE